MNSVSETNRLIKEFSITGFVHDLTTIHNSGGFVKKTTGNAHKF